MKNGASESCEPWCFARSAPSKWAIATSGSRIAKSTQSPRSTGVGGPSLASERDRGENEHEFEARGFAAEPVSRGVLDVSHRRLAPFVGRLPGPRIPRIG